MDIKMRVKTTLVCTEEDEGKVNIRMKMTHSASLRSLSDAWPGSIVAKDFRLFTTLTRICDDKI